MVKNHDLTEGSVLKSIWFLSLPMMFTMLMQQGFNVVDMYFVGKLGAEAIAAVSMAGIVVGLIITIVIGISMGTVAVVSRFVGEGNIDRADEVAMQAFILALILTVLVSFLGYAFTPSILSAIGAEGDVAAMGTDYLRIMFAGSGTIFVSIALFSALRGAGDPINPMIVMVVSFVINIALDPLLILGLFGFPALGVAGSAVATIASRIVSVVMILAIMFGGRSIVKLRMKDFRFDWSIMKRIVTIGNPSSLEFIIVIVSGLIIISIVSTFGTEAVAAYGIAYRLSHIVIVPAVGLGFASATLVGQNLGAKKPNRAEKSGWLCAGIGAVIMIGVSAFFLLFTEGIISFFSKDAGVVSTGVEFLHYFAPTFLFLSAGMSLARSLGGAGETVHPLILSVVTMLLLRIPLAYHLSGTGGLVAIWMVLAVTNVLYGLLMAGVFSLGRWKKKKI